MELKRAFGVRKTFAVLVIVNVAAVLALSGQSLDCTNDFDKFMFCQFGGENCAEYNMTLKNIDPLWNRDCIFKQCGSKKCCCSIQMDYFIAGEIFEATVWKEGKSMESKTINVTETIKPKRPTIVSVDETNGNFKVVWLTNTERPLRNSLTAEVTYHEKGSTQKVSHNVSQTPTDETNYYELQDLEPSTTYLVSVKSYFPESRLYSDSSEEWEFTTPVSSNTIFLAIIISLSLTAVLISAAIFGCCVKLKKKWWDSVTKYPNPKLLVVRTSEKEILKPMPPIISSVCVEPLLDDGKPWLKESLKDSSGGSLQQSSGISTGSSCPSYADTQPVNIIAEVQEALSKALPNIGRGSPSTANPPLVTDKGSSLLFPPHDINDFMADDMSSGSFGMLNKTYSILLPNCPSQSTPEPIDNQMPCDSDYHSSEGVTVISTYQLTPACPLITLPPQVPSSMPTDMSYQPCNADSGTFSFAEDSSSSSIASDTNTTASCDHVPSAEGAHESLERGNTEQVVVCDDNPCYGTVPGGSRSFPAVDFDYQPFQSGAVEQPGVLLSEKNNMDPEESLIKMPQMLFNQAVTCPMNSTELQRPFLSLMSATKTMPVITDSGYQCV
ncbi:uncharacterized protein LOC141787376 [Halichoeres trimaculatus]|uniref:uncharacterized protein LOC141787376 n=1 Tax=Halichoeres trimaculatus TaxID=147232 RepID=UPI003D9E2D2B